MLGLALVGVLGLALTLRLIGIRFGLPFVYNPDEVAIMSRALAFATGDFNPHNFVYPSLYFYLLFGWIGLYGLLALIIGRIDSIAGLERQFFIDPTEIFLAGRLLGVVCGVAAVGALYLLVRSLFGHRAAIVAALFLAVAPTAVRDAHYVKHDVPTTLLIILSIMAIVRVWPHPSRVPRRSTDLVVAALLCGVATSMHYYAVFLILPLASAVWFRYEDEGMAARLQALGIAAATSAIAFVACSPFMLTDYRMAIRDVVANRQIVVDRALGENASAFASAGRYLTMLWRDAIGWPIVVLAVVGLRWLWRLSARLTLALLIFPAVFLAFIGNTVPASRYLNPVLPFIAILAGLAVSSWSSRVKGWQRGVAAVLLALGAALPAVVASIQTGLFFRQTDTRTLAEQFIAAHIPSGSTVLVQPYSAPLRPSRASLIEATNKHLGQVERASTKVTRQLALDPYPEPSYRLFSSRRRRPRSGQDLCWLQRARGSARPRAPSSARRAIRRSHKVQ